jgi:DNA-binding NtrC family response regulator
MAQLHPDRPQASIPKQATETPPADPAPAIRGDQAHDAVPPYRQGGTLADMERNAIQQCLLQTGGNRQRTAEILGISTRTLLRKIRTYGLQDPLRAKDSSSGGSPPSR